MRAWRAFTSSCRFVRTHAGERVKAFGDGEMEDGWVLSNMSVRHLGHRLYACAHFDDF